MNRLFSGKIVDCQRDGFSDMVQDSGRAEKTGEARDSVGGCVSVAGGALGCREFASAGFAGEFEPGVADLDWRRAWD